MPDKVIQGLDLLFGIPDEEITHENLLLPDNVADYSLIFGDNEFAKIYLVCHDREGDYDRCKSGVYYLREVEDGDVKYYTLDICACYADEPEKMHITEIAFSPPTNHVDHLLFFIPSWLAVDHGLSMGWHTAKASQADRGGSVRMSFTSHEIFVSHEDFKKLKWCKLPPIQ